MRAIAHASERPFTASPDGVRLSVRLTPRAARNGLDGIVHGTDGRAVLQLRLVAPPVEGAANAALIAYLAVVLKMRKSQIRIASGEKGRRKLIDLAGEPRMIAERLDAWIAAAEAENA